jgi:hypothetical protein
VKECGDAINHIEQSLDAAEEIFRLLFPSFEITSATLLRPESPLTKRKRTVIDDSIAPNSLTSDIYAAVEWEENEDDGGGNRNPNSNPNSSVIKTISSAGLGSLGYNLVSACVAGRGRARMLVFTFCSYCCAVRLCVI